MKFWYLVLLYLIVFLFNLSSEDMSEDIKYRRKASIIDWDYVLPKEKLKRPSVLFSAGGNIFLKSRLLIKSDGTDTYLKLKSDGFDFVPQDRWVFNAEGRFYGRVTFSDSNFFHFSLQGLFNFTNQSIIPLINVDELYLNWKYPIGRIVIGRSFFNLMSETIFSGPLDAIELTINVPFLNFKTFVGFTGFLGVFNPYFNPYIITNYDRSFVSETNLIDSKIAIQFNGAQSRRIFFATDFDIYLFSQHINPFFLMQIDVSSVFGNSGHVVNTFHIGGNFEGKIVQNLFYTLNITGLFGTNQNASTLELKPITSFALQTNLRYSILSAATSTFIVGYAIGLGADDNGNFDSDNFSFTKESINKFYYYGKFDGGFCLNPILSNIQSLSVKYILTPKIKLNLVKLSFYTAFYQTFKVYSQGSISDRDAKDGIVVGSEFDIGMLINIGRNVSLNFDYGLLIPEESYLVNIPKMKAGINISVTF